MTKNIITKKGQINQVFIFLIAILVIGLIVVVASKSMGGLIKDKCNVDLITFKDSISSEIAANNDYGSRNEIKLSSPCQYTMLCVVNTDVLTGDAVQADIIGGEIQQSGSFPGAFIIGNSIQGQVKTNIFLTTQDGKETIEAGYVEQLKINSDQTDATSNVLCVNATAGYFRLRTEGLGRFTKLTRP
ncbi:hypothetical protein JXA48_01555 [Candidatus Woesearchaeota archaeon]|nr:hypothetical protein [Candidatus Woesearchaeota archaeon]